MKTRDYDNIRELLDRYYRGATSREEEAELMRFFSDADELPADMEADRMLFCGLSESADVEVDMPAEYSGRINAALEAEMRASAGRSASAWWRRKGFVRAAAACVALAVMVAAGIYIVRDDKSRPEVTVAHNLKPVAKEEVKVVAGNEVAPREAIASAVMPEKKHKKKSAGKDRGLVSAGMTFSRGQMAVEPEQEPEDAGYDDDEALMRKYEQEEQRMLAENYRVVEDEREASAIVASIFSRLEGNLTLESSRIDDIRGDYEMEINKLNQ